MKNFRKQETKLNEKLAEMKDRNRRNNLKFDGLAEESNKIWEKSEEKSQKVIK